MLLISLMANKLFIGLFTAYQKINYQFFEHTLTRIWPTDLSGRQNPQLVPLFSLCPSLTEAFGYLWTTGASVI